MGAFKVRAALLCTGDRIVTPNGHLATVMSNELEPGVRVLTVRTDGGDVRTIYPSPGEQFAYREVPE